LGRDRPNKPAAIIAMSAVQGIFCGLPHWVPGGSPQAPLLLSPQDQRAPAMSCTTTWQAKELKGCRVFIREKHGNSFECVLHKI
jgi:hypothetical protein